jgi:hypothetical protein
MVNCTDPEFKTLDANNQLVCTSECPSDKPYYSRNQGCVAQCPANIEVDGKTCTTGFSGACSNGTFLLGRNCVNVCPANYYVYTDPYDALNKICRVCSAGTSSTAGATSCTN